jgi:hypothetical protein
VGIDKDETTMVQLSRNGEIMGTNILQPIENGQAKELCPNDKTPLTSVSFGTEPDNMEYYLTCTICSYSEKE